MLALLAGPMRRTLDGVQALGSVARIPGRMPTAELLGAEAPLWASHLLQLEMSATQRTVEWRGSPGDVAGHARFSAGDATRWHAEGLARVRDALPGMRTVAELCALGAWLAAVDTVRITRTVDHTCQVTYAAADPTHVPLVLGQFCSALRTTPTTGALPGGQSCVAPSSQRRRNQCRGQLCQTCCVCGARSTPWG